MKKGLSYAKKMREEVVPDKMRKPGWGLAKNFESYLRSNGMPLTGIKKVTNVSVSFCSIPFLIFEFCLHHRENFHWLISL